MSNDVRKGHTIENSHCVLDIYNISYHFGILQWVEPNPILLKSVKVYIVKARKLTNSTASATCTHARLENRFVSATCDQII